MVLLFHIYAIIIGLLSYATFSMYMQNLAQTFYKNILLAIIAFIVFGILGILSLMMLLA